MAKSRSVEAIRNRQGWLYILPWIVGFLCFGLAPFIASFYISLTKWDIIGEPVFVGFENYVTLLTADPIFGLSFRNNLLFMLLGNGSGLILAFLVAALLNEKIPARSFFRVTFFLPSLVLPVALGLMMIPIFASEEFGLLNQLLTIIGLPSLYWLSDPNMAIWTMMLVSLWFFGTTMVVFLAGVAGIPRYYYEAAEIDGCGWWTRMRLITLPLLAPIIFFQLIMGLIYGLRIFDLAAALANVGQGTQTSMGQNDSLATMIFYLYMKGFRFWEMGTASAIGWIVFLIGFIFTLVIIRYLRKSQREQAGSQEVA